MPKPPKPAAAVEVVWKGLDILRPFLVPIDDLSPDPANARQHGDDNLEAIKASLRDFGQQKPTVHDAKMVMRAGNGTMAAARALAWTHIASIPTDLEGARATAFAIADNRTTDLSTWDEETLASLLKSLQEDGVPVPGWNDDDIEALLEGVRLKGPKGKSVEEYADDMEATQIRQIVLVCNPAEYDRALERLQKLMEDEGLASNTEAVLWLLDHIEDCGWRVAVPKNDVEPPAA